MGTCMCAGCVHVTMQGTVDESTHLASLAGGLIAAMKHFILGALADIPSNLGVLICKHSRR